MVVTSLPPGCGAVGRGAGGGKPRLHGEGRRDYTHFCLKPESELPPDFPFM